PRCSRTPCHTSHAPPISATAARTNNKIERTTVMIKDPKYPVSGGGSRAFAAGVRAAAASTVGVGATGAARSGAGPDQPGDAEDQQADAERFEPRQRDQQRAAAQSAGRDERRGQGSAPGATPPLPRSAPTSGARSSIQQSQSPCRTGVWSGSNGTGQHGDSLQASRSSHPAASAARRVSRTAVSSASLAS